MSLRIGLRRVITVAMGLVIGSGPSLAQDAPRLFGETIDVRLVNVEVVVTDRSGERVTGLDASDFALVVDGREVPVDFFTEIRDRQVVASADDRSLPLGAVPGETLGTNYLVFVDEFFSIGAHRDLVVEGLRDELALLNPADRMAIVAFDGDGLDVLADWTGDAERLSQAFDAALDRPTRGLLRDPERRRSGRERIPGVGIARQELEMELRAVTASMRAMPRPEGRSVLVLLAGAWPSDPFFTYVGGLPTTARGNLAVDDLAMIEPVVETANLLGYTIYPIDVAGLRSTGTSGARELFRWGTLRVVAGDTGGRAVLAGERLSPLGAAARDTSSYYWLGFSPERRGDGRAHSIEVKVRNPALRARARAGYRDLTRDDELAMAIESDLLFGAAPRSERLGLSAGISDRIRGGKMTVPLSVEIPWRELTLVPLGEELVGEAELRFAVKDERGVLSPVASAPLSLSRPLGTTDERSLLYEADLTLWREPHDLVVSLYDLASGRTITESIRIEP